MQTYSKYKEPYLERITVVCILRAYAPFKSIAFVFKLSVRNKCRVSQICAHTLIAICVVQNNSSILIAILAHPNSKYSTCVFHHLFHFLQHGCIFFTLPVTG